LDAYISTILIFGSELFSLKFHFSWFLVQFPLGIFFLVFETTCTCLWDGFSFTISQKPSPSLMEGDLWLLRRLSNIFILSWNLDFYIFLLILILMSLPHPIFSLLSSSNCVLNLIISSLSQLYCSSNSWSSSSFHLFDFSISVFREMISTSSPSQYHFLSLSCLVTSAMFVDSSLFLFSYTCKLTLRLSIPFKS